MRNSSFKRSIGQWSYGYFQLNLRKDSYNTQIWAKETLSFDSKISKWNCLFMGLGQIQHDPNLYRIWNRSWNLKEFTRWSKWQMSFSYCFFFFRVVLKIIEKENPKIAIQGWAHQWIFPGFFMDRKFTTFSWHWFLKHLKNTKSRFKRWCYRI